MLTVLRSVLPAPLMPGVDRGCGRADVGAGLLGGKKFVDGARRPLLGVDGFDFAGVASVPVLLRVLVTGSAGSAAVGGPLDGLEALGRAVAILTEFASRYRTG